MHLRQRSCDDHDEPGIEDGHIICVNSISMHKFGAKTLYSGNKFAVTALTECLRRDGFTKKAW